MQQAVQHLSLRRLLARWSPFPLSFPYHRTSRAACLPHVPAFLCVSKPEKLDEKQRQQVDHLRKGHRDLDCAYQLGQAFVLMLAQRRGKDLDEWLIQAERSGIAELKSFAQGLRRDEAAVRAAFSSPWSQGQVEARVNCLKLQKRLTFGRAKFDLLRLRVLHRWSFRP